MKDASSQSTNKSSESTESMALPSLKRLWILYILAVIAIALLTWWLMQFKAQQRYQLVEQNNTQTVAQDQATGSHNLNPVTPTAASATPANSSPADSSPAVNASSSTSTSVVSSANQPVVLDLNASASTAALVPDVDAAAVQVLSNAPAASSLVEEMQRDVLVYGSEPEAISAAVSAAEQGARVTLVTPDPKVGGLFVMGQMNSLDLRTEPVLMQRGFFERWWDKVGRGSAFDVQEAEAAFEQLLAEADVEVIRNAQDVRAITSQGRVIGVRFNQTELTAKQVIDGSADADLAAQVGVPYSMGFASMGIDARMVDTLVFRIDGVNWRTLRREINRRGKAYAQVDNRVAWGFFGHNWIKDYEAQEEGIRLRGLNLGRQNDGSILVNALLIHGIDPASAESRAEGIARASREAVHIIDLLKTEIDAFADASFGGVAPALYIRETQHILAECTLTVDDVLGNVVTEYDVAAGGYPLDVQVLTPNDTGFVYGVPEVYGVQLCVTVPLGIDGLWIAGKAAGYDPLAASSARVVPFGMALAEAVGVAAARAGNQSPSDIVNDDAAMLELRRILQERGAYLAEVKPRNPSGPYQHEFFDDFVTLRSKALALGGYNNDPQLDATMPALGYLYLLGNVAERFYNRQGLAQYLIDMVGFPEGDLTPEWALNLSRYAACGLEHIDDCPQQSWQEFTQAGGSPQDFSSQATLSRGEAYSLAAVLARRAP